MDRNNLLANAYPHLRDKKRGYDSDDFQLSYSSWFGGCESRVTCWSGKYAQKWESKYLSTLDAVARRTSAFHDYYRHVWRLFE